MKELVSREELPLKELQQDLAQLKGLVDKGSWTIFETKLKQGHLDVGELGNTMELEQDVLSKLIGGVQVTFLDERLNVNSLGDLRQLIEESAGRLTSLTAEKSFWNLPERIKAKGTYDELRIALALAELVVKAEERHSLGVALDLLRQAVTANPTLSANKQLQGLLGSIDAKLAPQEMELRLWIEQVLRSRRNVSKPPVF